MSKGPGLFTDFGKKAKDLLTKDYSCDQKFTVTTYSENGLAITSTAVKKGGLSTGDVATQCKYKNALIDLKLDTESNVSTTIIFTEILPSMKTIASFKLPDYNSGKLEVQYFHEHATFTTALALNQSPIIDLSAAIGTPTFAFGAEAGYEAKSGSFSKYNTGFSVTQPDYSFSMILADKGDTLKASYVHHLDQMNRSAGVADITRRFSLNENTFTVGGSYAVDPQTVMKARLNNHGKLGALLQHELKPKSVIIISGEFDTKTLDKNPRFGLSLSLKP
ncbi:mitochondrial outer membrane protein porin 2-like [Macadamia integrifolia]|uniref:mitochondrial outer membrane protein porin 2-like n=1 Tax=Macadamia integrifolia TaxID=60698 RepID=UPI001C4FD1C7|nr:mitochondrial outer membrane protein porin 2-like [Macadamia integrifolia]